MSTEDPIRHPLRPGATEHPQAKPASTTTMRIEVAPKSMLLILAFIVCLWLLARLLPVVLVLIFALMLAGTLGPAVEWFERRGVQRGWSIAIVFCTLLGAAGLLLALTIPAFLSQAKSLIEAEPAMREKMAEWLSSSKLTAGVADAMRNVQYDTLIKASAATVIGYSTRAVEIVAYAVGAVFLALYILIDRDRLRGGLFAVVPRAHHVRLSRILLNLEIIVGGYIRGQAITCALLGGFMMVLLTVCGVPNALALSVFGGLADVLPYVGIFLTMVPAVVAALQVSTATALIVFVLLLVYEEFESRVLVPVVYGRALRLPSSVVLLSLIAGATLLGIIGALLALPIAAAILMLIEELRVELPGETVLASDTATRVQDMEGEREYIRRTEGMPATEAAAVAVEIAEERGTQEDVADPALAPRSGKA